MKETILSIVADQFKLKEFAERYDTEFEGFVITTSKQVIKLGIDNNSQCCENWGYFMSHDNIEEFIGATLVSVNIVDESLNVSKLPDIGENDYMHDRSVKTMFVNIETNIGTLQFTAYNEHNGYYSHEAVVVSEQLNESVSL